MHISWAGIYSLVALIPGCLVFEYWLERFSKKRKSRLFYDVQRKGMSKLKKISWQDFEKVCAGYFTSRGYSVKLTGLGGADDGMDLIVSKRGHSAIVQCKHWKSKVGVVVIREMFGLMHANNHQEVYVIALSGFTKKAEEFAMGKPIHLISGDSLLS
ncbi:restriction endonuclease [Pseudomonas luteola]